MMICKADFEELFPDLFQPEPATTANQMTKLPSVECLARWEDDGGRSWPATTRSDQVASARMLPHGSDLPVISRTDAIVAGVPVAAAYAAVWSMLSAYGRVTTDQYSTL